MQGLAALIKLLFGWQLRRSGEENARYYATQEVLAPLRAEKREWEAEALNAEDAEEYATTRRLGFSHDEAIGYLHRMGRGCTGSKPPEALVSRLIAQSKEIYAQLRAVGFSHERATAVIAEQLAWTGVTFDEWYLVFDTALLAQKISEWQGRG